VHDVARRHTAATGPADDGAADFEIARQAADAMTAYLQGEHADVSGKSISTACG
jgi:hypothetical protein